MLPHKDNFCGGKFQDWLEVMLTPACNGRCAWCVEKDGFRPSKVASWRKIADAALKTNRTNIILLGGEPTLYEKLGELINYLAEHDRHVWVTTNGSTLTAGFVEETLRHVTGVNVSIHHHSLEVNERITGILLYFAILNSAVGQLHNMGSTVRFNCNCIHGYIDDYQKILQYIDFAKSMRADCVRFAELKNDVNGFVDLNKIMDGMFGLNDDPFTLGCGKHGVINGMSVQFRQMCGLQTPLRVKPACPEQFQKQVLYYDGEIYPGWVSKKEGCSMGTRKADDAGAQLGEINRQLMKKIQSMQELTASMQELQIKKVALETKLLLETQGLSTGNGCVY